MKATKKIVAFLIAMLLCINMMSVPVFAASLNQDGLEISMVTDKEEYSKDEDITVTLSVKNTNDFSVTDVKLENIVPEGYKHSKDSEVNKGIEEIKPGETVKITAVYEPEAVVQAQTPVKTKTAETKVSAPVLVAAASPKTGDGSNTMLWILLLVAAVAGIVIVGLKKKNILVLKGKVSYAIPEQIALTDLAANRTQLGVNRKEMVVFTVNVQGEPEEVNLFEEDGTIVGAMYDNGKNGDTKANDGIYTYVHITVESEVCTVSFYAEAESETSNQVTLNFSDKMSGYGRLAGKVFMASDRTTLISGAKVEIDVDGLKVSFITDDEGDYSAPFPAGTYVANVSAEGYIPVQTNITVTAGITVYENFYLIKNSDVENGVASGIITNALNGKVLEGATLQIRENWNNTNVGEVVATVETNANGEYSVNLPLGNYTIHATKEGFISNSFNIIVQPGTTGNQNGTLTPILSENEYRVILTWGETPKDLDSHLVGKRSDGTDFHGYFAKKKIYEGETLICKLDVDDRISYGPETITLTATSDSPYYYYVYQYTEDGSLAISNAQVKVYQGDAMIASFTVATDQGEGRFWNVFAIVDGSIVVKNTISDSADLSYAGSTSVSATSVMRAGSALKDIDEEITEDSINDKEAADTSEEKITEDEVMDAPSEEVMEEETTDTLGDEVTEEVTEAPEDEVTEEETEAPEDEVTEDVTEAPEDEVTEEVTEAPEDEVTEEVTDDSEEDAAVVDNE